MAGATEKIVAPTIEELQQRVEAWYERAAGQGLEDARLPWNPEGVRQTDDGFEFNVWAHS
jgi:hypothetical protein